jgi:hypothetical protein
MRCGRTGFFLFILLVLPVGLTAVAGAGDKNLFLQVVRPQEDVVLWESPVRQGECFTIDYRHSSDHTPVHDVFRIAEDAEIVLIEESYRWYGAGLAFHPADGTMDTSGGWTRVLLNRKFPHFLLRVGEVANHVLSINGRSMPLLQIAEGREQVWIRTMRKTETKR